MRIAGAACPPRELRDEARELLEVEEPDEDLAFFDFFFFFFGVFCFFSFLGGVETRCAEEGGAGAAFALPMPP